MEDLCSFNGFGGICCTGDGAHGAVKLNECTADVSGLLSSCGLSRLQISEAQLILYRAGRFAVTQEQQEKMSICSAHRSKLGTRWRPLRSCQYPSHTGLLRRYKNRMVFGIQLSTEVMSLYGTLVQIGSREFDFINPLDFCFVAHSFLVGTPLICSLVLLSMFSNMPKLL